MLLIESILCGFLILFGGFVVNEMGQRFSDAFNKVDDAVSQLNWYLFPNEVQRMLPTFIINTQEPVVIRFFGSNVCSREQYKKVKV